MMLTIQYVFQIDIEKKPQLKLTGPIVGALTGLPDIINQCTPSNPSQKDKNV